MGSGANGMQVREGFGIPLAITIRSILGEMRKRNVLMSQWHLFPSFPTTNNP